MAARDYAGDECDSVEGAKPVVSGLVSHIQRYSIQDGPGIRTTVFLKGCPLRCAWCHNPENRVPQPEVVAIEGRCIRCGECVPVCPAEAADSAITPAGPRAACQRCGACVDACPAGARVLVGQAMSVPEVLTEICRDQVFYEDSGGGVTFSGGEPLAQPEFLSSALAACRRRGIHTAIDTCGYAPTSQFLAIAPLADLFLYDLKFMDDALHCKFTGVSNQAIIENLEHLARLGRAIWIRIPLIPGVNDHDFELDTMARFIAALPGVQQVNLLPYHMIGIHKFARIGQEYGLPGLTPPSAERMKDIVARFAAGGLKAKAGG